MHLWGRKMGCGRDRLNETTTFGILFCSAAEVQQLKYREVNQRLTFDCIEYVSFVPQWAVRATETSTMESVTEEDKRTECQILAQNLSHNNIKHAKQSPLAVPCCNRKFVMK